MHTSRIVRVFAPLAMGTLTLTACGSNDTDTTAEATPTGVSSTALDNMGNPGGSDIPQTLPEYEMYMVAGPYKNGVDHNDAYRDHATFAPECANITDDNPVEYFTSAAAVQTGTEDAASRRDGASAVCAKITKVTDAAPAIDTLASTDEISAQNPDYPGYFTTLTLLDPALGGSTEHKNLVTGTAYAAGGDDGHGGMAYAKETVKNYLSEHPDGSVMYYAEAIYGDSSNEGGFLANHAESITINLLSDDGSINEMFSVTTSETKGLRVMNDGRVINSGR